MRFTRLTIIKELPRAVYKNTSARRYLCHCDCGKTFSALRPNILRGSTKSCGCWKRETARAPHTHGMSHSSEYKIWAGIKKRCHNPRQREFHLWGGRGITMCGRWRESFEAFFSDMGKRPSARHSIDRIDNNGNYEPQNCRWATPIEQSANSRKTKHFATEQITLSAYCRLHGLPYSRVYHWVVRKKQKLSQFPVNTRISTSVPGEPLATHI